MTAYEIDLKQAHRQLATERWRVAQDIAVWGAVDKSLAWRLAEALRRVRYLEVLAA